MQQHNLFKGSSLAVAIYSAHVKRVIGAECSPSADATLVPQYTLRARARTTAEPANRRCVH